MSYMSGIPKTNVAWATDLSHAAFVAADRAGAALGLEVVFWLPKTGVRKREVTGAHADLYSHRIELLSINTVETTYKRWVIIHETAHLIDFAKHGRQYSDKGRAMNHSQTFWDIAIPLYRTFEVLDVAKKFEYVTGRKLIAGIAV